MGIDRKSRGRSPTTINGQAGMDAGPTDRNMRQDDRMNACSERCKVDSIEWGNDLQRQEVTCDGQMIGVLNGCSNNWLSRGEEENTVS